MLARVNVRTHFLAGTGLDTHLPTRSLPTCMIPRPPAQTCARECTHQRAPAEGTQACAHPHTDMSVHARTHARINTRAQERPHSHTHEGTHTPMHARMHPPTNSWVVGRTGALTRTHTHLRRHACTSRAHVHALKYSCLPPYTHACAIGQNRPYSRTELHTHTFTQKPRHMQT